MIHRGPVKKRDGDLDRVHATAMRVLQVIMQALFRNEKDTKSTTLPTHVYRLAGERR